MNLFDFKLFKKNKSIDVFKSTDENDSNAKDLSLEKAQTNRVVSNKKSGFFDGIHESGSLYGWAHNSQEDGRNQKLYFFINQILVGTAWTWQDRPDVAVAKGVDAKNAGFYCALFSDEYFQLLQVGYELTVAFDELGGHKLEGLLVLDSENIPRLLGGTLRTLANSNSNVPYDQILKIFSVPSLSKRIHWTDKACLFADYLLSLYQISSDEQLLIQAEKAAQSWGLPKNFLELKLLRILWCVDHSALGLIDVGALDMAFLKRKHESDPLGNFQGLKNKDIHLMNILQQKLFFQSQLANEQTLIAISNISFTFGKWIEKIGGQDRLALAFMDLARQQDIAKMDHALVTEIIGRLQRKENRNVLAAENFRASISSGESTWYSHHELAVLIRASSQDDLGYSVLPLEHCFSLWIKAMTLNPSQALSYREAISYSNVFFEKLMSYTDSRAQSGSEMNAVLMREDCLRSLGNLTKELYKAQQISFNDVNSQNWINKNNKKILFLGSKNLHQCFHYRIIQKMELFKTLGFECEFIDTKELSAIQWRESLMGVALLYLCRTALTNNERHLIGYAKALKIPIVYDIDDFIFDAEYFPPQLDHLCGNDQFKGTFTSAFRLPFIF